MITNQLLSWMIFQYTRDSGKLFYVAVGQIDYARTSSYRFSTKSFTWTNSTQHIIYSHMYK